MRLDEIELLNSIKEESNICSFRLIERNVLKGNKDRRERCKIRGKKKRSDCFVHVRGSYFRSRRNRYLGDTKCRQERARNLMSFLCLCGGIGGIKTEAAEKKWRKKRSGPLMARQRPRLYTKSSQGSIERRFGNFLSAIDSFFRFDVCEIYVVTCVDIQGCNIISAVNFFRTEYLW